MVRASFDGIAKEVESGRGVREGGDDASNDEQGGGGQGGEIGEGGDGGDLLRLIRARSLGEDKHWRFGRDGGRLEPRGDFGVVGSGHIDDYGGFGGETDAREKLGFGGTGKGGEEYVGGKTTIRER